jgi:hypothetical protein
MSENKFVLSNSLILMVLFLMVLLLVSGTSLLLAADTQAFPDDGLKNTKIEWFHTLRFFDDSKDTNELSVEAVKEHHEKIDKILDAGINPIGAVNSWTFPNFANAPKVPGPEMHMGIPVAKKDAIPSFTDSEYRRLVEVRAKIYESIAEEFPEIDT